MKPWNSVRTFLLSGICAISLLYPHEAEGARKKSRQQDITEPPPRLHPVWNMGNVTELNIKFHPAPNMKPAEVSTQNKTQLSRQDRTGVRMARFIFMGTI